MSRHITIGTLTGTPRSHTESYLGLYRPYPQVKTFARMSVSVCAEDLRELHQKEKEANIKPDWEMDTYTKAAVQSGKRESIATDLMLKLLGLDVGS